MFERFTDRARRVVVLAQEEARMLNHNYIGTEHILLGLIHEGKALPPSHWSRWGSRWKVCAVRSRRSSARASRRRLGTFRLPPRQKVLELSLREALQLGHNYIGTEHILLGLIREGEGVAAQVLVKLGAELTRVRQQVIQLLSGYQGKEAAEAGTGGRGESPALRLRPWCSTSSAATSRRRRWKANWTRSSAARRKSSGSCRCSLGAPRTTRC